MSHFGIDFGTTNSGAFEMNGVSSQHFGDEEGKPLPSIIVIDRTTDKPLTGRAVWNRRLSLSETGGYRVIPPLKTLLADTAWHEGRWTVVDLVAVILRRLSERAVTMGVEGGIQQATFSIPVGLPPEARRTIRKAARLAGIQVNSFINESTAALMRYWARVRDHRYVAVFDWGGGTLDVSVIELHGHTILERHTKSLPRAGIHIDGDLARFVHTRITRERGVLKAFEDIPKEDRNELLICCEIAKRALSEMPETELSLVRYDDKPVQLLLTRQECAPVVAPYAREAVEFLGGRIVKAGISCDEIQEIIVIGGSSKLWLLPEMLAAVFPKRNYMIATDAEWDVAHGAAIVDQNPGQFTLSETLGLRLSDETYFELARPGDRPVAAPSSLSLAFVEDSNAANIIVDRWTSDHAQPQTALQFAVPSMGFDQEEILLRYRLTEDLTFQITGQSRSRGPASLVERETGELRFGYEME